ncbi:MAG: hypothetical protein KC478_12585 [Bacteriovoracaceae bacterium]|nr:hypothetical protein [Bacteriovoracaceae bacterium]
MQKLIIALIFLSTYAIAGRDGNGGNEIALRFTQIAANSLKFLETPGKNTHNLDLDKLESAIKNTKVYSVTYKLCADDSDKLCPEEAGFVAKNYPEKNEILVSVDKWKALSIEEKVRIVIHEYLGMIDIETGNYNVSSNIVVALGHKEGEQYACQLSLIKNSYPTRILGSAGFVVHNSGVKAMGSSDPIKNSKNDVVFRMVSAKDYLRGSVEISEVDRGLPFLYVKKRNEILFDNVTFFNGEPIGVKVFKKDDKLLQISCVHI